jgi:hypothetical protein
MMWLVVVKTQSQPSRSSIPQQRRLADTGEADEGDTTVATFRDIEAYVFAPTGNRRQWKLGTHWRRSILPSPPPPLDFSPSRSYEHNPFH